jgi:hypothetical protein
VFGVDLGRRSTSLEHPGSSGMMMVDHWACQPYMVLLYAEGKLTLRFLRTGGTGDKLLKLRDKRGSLGLFPA